jgi:hypothetical protein
MLLFLQLHDTHFLLQSVVLEKHLTVSNVIIYPYYM